MIKRHNHCRLCGVVDPYEFFPSFREICFECLMDNHRRAENPHCPKFERRPTQNAADWIKENYPSYDDNLRLVSWEHHIVDHNEREKTQ